MKLLWLKLASKNNSPETVAVGRSFWVKFLSVLQVNIVGNNIKFYCRKQILPSLMAKEIYLG